MSALSDLVKYAQMGNVRYVNDNGSFAYSRRDEAAEELAEMQSGYSLLKEHHKEHHASEAAKNHAIESAIAALQAVVHDRPTAHSDAVWQQVITALAELESLKWAS